jgi:hypothetical protein
MDSDIKAGAFGEGGIVRATTVPYSCGTALDLNVKGDLPCHYIFDNSVPPYAIIPYSKLQFLKEAGC